MPHFGDWSWRHIRNILNSNGREWPPLGPNIQRAIDDLGTEGGVVWLPKGDLTAYAQITIPNHGVTIQGCGNAIATLRGVTRIIQADGVNGAPFIDVTGFNTQLRDIFIDGNSAGNPTGTILVRMLQFNQKIENVALYDAPTIGFYGQTLAGGYFKNVYSEYSQVDGYEIHGSRNSVFVDCVAASNVRHGFMITHETEDNTFLGCLSDLDAENGFVIWNDADEETILNSFIGCQVWNSGRHGFLLSGSQRNTFDDCLVKNAGIETNNLYDAFRLESYLAIHCLRNILKGNQVRSDHANAHRNGMIEADANQNRNIFIGNVLTDAATANLVVNGANSIYQTAALDPYNIVA